MKSARAFVAFEIPRNVVNTLVQKRGDIERGMPPARWVRSENLHLTLMFLGDVPVQTLDVFYELMSQTLEGLSAPRISLNGSGFFPDTRRPRVAWIGGTASGVEEVHDGVNRAAFEAGLTLESKPWSLHLTQARLNRPWPRKAVSEFVRWGEGLDLPPFDANEVVVFTSELHPCGPVYTSLERIRLQ